MTPDLIIANGHVIDPACGLDGPHDVLIRDGLIAAVERPGTFAAFAHADTIDATGLLVAPGLIDIHVHLREPGQTYKETIATGTAAAAAGGFTTVVAMPNTLPVNDSVATLAWMLDAARKPVTRLFATPAATLGSLGVTLSDFDALAKAGALGFTDDGKPILATPIMRAALVAAARLGLPISQHAEDPAMSNGAIMNAGPVAFRLGLRGYPAEAEASIVRRDLDLLREIERAEHLHPHLHVQHVSTELALAAIREAKAQGLHVTCEAAPHHFALTDEAIGDFDTNAKMNPPLRAESDRQAVLAALVDGTIDCIATDHAPHARHEKEVEFERAANGITGLETALGLALRLLHQEAQVPLARIIRLMSTNPAEIVGLRQAGSLLTGKWADLVLFDPTAEWSFDASASVSRSRNTPFDGTKLLGRVKATLVAGRIVHRGGQPLT
jgi:dihydroorotase